MQNDQPPATPLVAPTWVALLLSLAIVVAYFGFMLLVALAKPSLGMMIAPGISLGLILAAAVLLLCIVASFVFVVMENRKAG